MSILGTSAFFAGLNENFSVKEKTALHFDNVVTNVGKNFDTAESAYMVPISGTYQFNITVTAQPKQKAAAHLVKQATGLTANTLLTVFAESSSTGATASNTLILELKQAEQVSLVVSPDAPGLCGNMRTTFSGSLLFPTELM